MGRLTPEVTLEDATLAEQAVVRNLMQLYLYDTSDHTGEDPGPSGQYDYRYLDHYWTEAGRAQEGRRPFLIRVDGVLAGFVLVKGTRLTHLPGERWIAEFFVMKKWRRQGVGRQAAFELFRRLPGGWQIGQERVNLASQAFWAKVVAEFTGGRFREMDSRPPAWDGPILLFHS